MAEFNPVDSTLRQVALSVVESYNSWCLDSIMAYRAPNCIHHFLPASLGRRPMTNASYRAYWSKTKPYFRHFHATNRDVVADAAANKVALWGSCKAETDVGPFANEYMFVLHLDTEGKVDEFVEFVDSVKTTAFYGRLRKLMKERNETADGEKLQRARL